MEYLWIKEALTKRKSQGQYRELRILDPAQPPYLRLEGQKLLDFSSNNYLGLSRHPELIKQAQQYGQTYGAGSTASRLVCANLSVYPPIEAKLAQLKGTEKALILGSGFQTNIALPPALAGPGDLILADKLIHNSLIQGAKLSRADFRRFRHNDLDHLEHLLSQTHHKKVFVLAETVYSMDGDRPDLPRLVQLCQQAQAFLILDEAHATGVLGPNGMGLSVGLGADLVMGTFGKGLGSFGSYLAGSAELINYLVNFHTGLIYSTALPPSVLGSINAALDLVPTLGAERAELQKKAAWTRAQLQLAGFDTLNSSTQIIPVIAGSEARCLGLADHLKEQGYLTSPIRPPTVPPNQSRIRLSLNTGHTEAHLRGLVEAFSRWRPE